MESTGLTPSLRETLDVFEATGETCEPLTTREVAGHLDVGRRSTYERLERLADQSHLRTKKVGARGRVWWRPPSPQETTKTGDGDSRPPVQPGVEFRALVDAVEEYAIFRLDPEGYIRTWNSGAEQIKGYDPEEIIDQHFSTFYTADDRDGGVPERNLEAAAEGGEIEDEGWRVRADGSRFWANVTITAIRDDEGDLLGFAKVTRDMTERREREQRLREEKAFTESMFENQRDLVYAYDTDGTVLRWNDRLAEVTGYSEAEIERMTLPEFIADEESERTEAAIEQVLDGNESVTVELPLETADGQQIPHEFTAAPMREESGEVTGVTGVGRDISDRKAKERQLKRRQEELERELDEVFERIDDAFVGVDNEWRISYVNDEAAELVQLPPGELLGERIWDALPEVADGRPRRVAERAIETQESAEFEFFSELLSLWVEVRLYPSENGLSVYFRDISERKERERELELHETIVEEARDGVYVLDDDFCFTMVNEAYVEMTGYDREDLLGRHCSLVIDDAVVQNSAQSLQDIFQEEGGSATLEAALQRADGGTLRAESKFTGIEDAETGEPKKVGIVRDVQERVERERELEEAKRQYQTLIEHFPNGAVAMVDPGLRYVTVGGTPLEEAEKTVDDLEGQHLESVLPTELSEVLVPKYEAALAGETQTFVNDVGERYIEFQTVPVRDDDGEVFAALGMSQDITDRKQREDELQNRLRQQQVVADLSHDALETRDLDDLMDEAARLVAGVLDNDYCKVLDLDAGGDELLLRQGVGWHDAIVGEATVAATEDDSQAAYTLSVDEPVVVEDLETDTRFSGPDLLRNHDVRSGISVIIGPHEDPWGILGTHDTEAKDASEDDVNFVQAVANILATAIERHRHEEQLVQQREQLEALNSLNEVVQDITEAVIDRSTREEIERAVVGGLADADSFSFAWIGEVDGATREVELRTEAGVEGYLNCVTITTDPEDDRSQGPTARALLTGEAQVTQDIQSSPGHDPWRDHVEAHDVRSSAAIPIIHEGTTYGVLNVYADRPNAFEAAERRVLTQLGEVAGHAIAAVDRKRALMSDEVVELEFHIPNVFQALGIEAKSEGKITLDRAVPAGDGSHLMYGNATDDAWTAVESIVDAVPHWESVQDLDHRGDRHHFEVTLTDPPVLSVVASRGGYVQEAVIEDGDYHMTIHLPPTVDSRSIIGAVEDAYPMANLVAQRQLSQTDDTGARFERLLHEELTERQRAAVETAFYAGFFEWPRESDGEAVSEALGVSPPTFHQHLRKAERKVFETLLKGPVSADETATP